MLNSIGVEAPISPQLAVWRLAASKKLHAENCPSFK
jgi:hypothetical protein